MARETRFEIRQTEDENREYKTAAAEDGYDKLAPWLRWLARRRITEQDELKSARAKNAKKRVG